MNDCEDTEACAIAHGLNNYAVGVVIIDYQHMVVASAGRDNEFSGLVRVNLTGGGCDDRCEAMMGASIVGVRC